MIAQSRFAVVFVLFIVVASYLVFRSDAEVPMNRNFSEFPSSHKGWHMVSESFMDAESQRVLKATDYIYRKYTAPDGQSVSLYIGYHNGGKNSGAIHSPKHCLPGSGWFEVKTGERVLEWDGSRINMVNAVYQKSGSKDLFMYWFQVRQKTVANELALKREEIMNSLLHGRKDSTFIRVSVPLERDEAIANAAGERFIKDFYPLIMTFLPH